MNPERILNDVHKTVPNKNMELMFAPKFTLTFAPENAPSHRGTSRNLQKKHHMAWDLLGSARDFLGSAWNFFRISVQALLLEPFSPLFGNLFETFVPEQTPTHSRVPKNIRKARGPQETFLSGSWPLVKTYWPTSCPEEFLAMLQYPHFLNQNDFPKQNQNESSDDQKNQTTKAAPQPNNTQWHFLD